MEKRTPVDQHISPAQTITTDPPPEAPNPEKRDPVDQKQAWFKSGNWTAQSFTNRTQPSLYPIFSWALREAMSRQPFVGLYVLVPGLLHDIVRQSGGGAVFVPVGSQ